jgi:ribose transport system ATP-binding protein
VSVLLVTHHIDEVFDIADHVTVLRDGQWVSTDRIEDLTHDGLVARMIGRAVEERGRLAEAGSGSDEAIVLDVQNVSTTVLRGISLSVRKGEVVGIAGLTGSGREQLGPALFGAIPRQGSVAVLGTKLAAHDPHAAVAAGMALVPAERHANALFLDSSVATNVTAVGTERFTRFGLVAAGRESADVDDWIRRLGVNPPDGKRPIATLSGGNQQKVVLARWLRNDPAILILDDPTQGVDVGAKAEIHQLVASAAAQGAAVLVISTDHEELTSLCHRVEVLVRGQLSASLPGHELSDSVITAATLAAASSVTARVGEPA